MALRAPLHFHVDFVQAQNCQVDVTHALVLYSTLASNILS